MKILVPIDGSKYSDKALIHACELAKIQKATLTIIYVVDKSMGIDLFDRSEYLSILRKYGKNALKRAAKIALKSGITTKQIIKEGKIADEIVKFAKKDSSNLIVAGCKGLRAISKFLLGSLSTKLASHSPCATLIVK